MFNNQDEIDFILETAMQGKPITQDVVGFILEDFPEGGKILINERDVFEILKVENGTVLMKPIGTCLLVRDTPNRESGITTRRYIQDGKIVKTSI